MSDSFVVRSPDATPAPVNKVEIFVIGGWLGSGKTTFLNHLLNDRAKAFQTLRTRDRVAVLVNDVGDVHLDPLWIKQRDARSIELLDGCICCSIGDSLAVVLRDLVLGPSPPRTIFIEASGLAQPGKVAQYGDRRRVVIRDVLVAVDVMDIEKRLADATYGNLASQQLVEAKRLVLTKTDLVTDAALYHTRKVLETRFEAPICTMAEAVDLALRPAATAGDVGLSLDGTRAARSLASGSEQLGVHTTDSFTWRPGGAVATQALETVLEMLAGQGVLRAKGVCLDSFGGSYVVQLAGSLVNRELFPGSDLYPEDVQDGLRDDLQGKSKSESSLVVIFDPTRLDRKTIEEHLETCWRPRG